MARSIWKRLVRSDCQHPHTLVVTSVGVRRWVCETCGHISFKMVPLDTRDETREEASGLDRVAGL